ncbi:MAG: 2-phosphoglycerate kinase [Candidatus Thermoplasmatota archaeon]|jgi:2-phosphoglycerate kinase|nr:2-phosphoglycerate kinase [Candidatus Thermoplasmatota archaeon]
MMSGRRKKVIFIGGTPGVGKTSISGYLAKALGIDLVLSGDYLREFLRGSDPERFRNLSVSVYDSWKLYGERTRENLLKGFMDQAVVMNRGFESIISRSVSNGEPLIVETLYYVPNFLETFFHSLVTFYLYIGDESTHRLHLNERTRFTHPDSPGERLSAHLDEYREIMNTSMDLCNEHGIKTFDTSDFISARDRILIYVKQEFGNEH